jgi:hypothetical protein
VSGIKGGTETGYLRCVLRRAFGWRRDVIITGWRILHEEEIHNLYPLPNIIRMIKSRKMGLIEHVARMGRRRMHT